MKIKLWKPISTSANPGGKSYMSSICQLKVERTDSQFPTIWRIYSVLGGTGQRYSVQHAVHYNEISNQSTLCISNPKSRTKLHSPQTISLQCRGQPSNELPDKEFPGRDRRKSSSVGERISLISYSVGIDSRQRLGLTCLSFRYSDCGVWTQNWIDPHGI